MAPSKTTKKAKRQTILIWRSNKCIPRRLRGEDQIAREILLNKLIRRNELSALEYFENLSFKKKTKNASLNGCISKASASAESKQIFSESSFSFLQNSVLFCALYPPGYTTWAPRPTTPGAAASGSRSSELKNI